MSTLQVVSNSLNFKGCEIVVNGSLSGKTTNVFSKESDVICVSKQSVDIDDVLEKVGSFRFTECYVSDFHKLMWPFESTKINVSELRNFIEEDKLKNYANLTLRYGYPETPLNKIISQCNYENFRIKYVFITLDFCDTYAYHCYTDKGILHEVITKAEYEKLKEMFLRVEKCLSNTNIFEKIIELCSI